MATDKATYPSDAAEKFIVRFPPGMRERIAESARANNRSMNSEVIERLQRSFQMVDEEFQEVGDRFAEAMVIQRLDSLRARWSADRNRVLMLEDRLNRLRRDDADRDALDNAERELWQAQFELEETEDLGKAARAELDRLNGQKHGSNSKP